MRYMSQDHGPTPLMAQSLSRSSATGASRNSASDSPRPPNAWTHGYYGPRLRAAAQPGTLLRVASSKPSSPSARSIAARGRSPAAELAEVRRQIDAAAAPASCWPTTILHSAPHAESSATALPDSPAGRAGSTTLLEPAAVGLRDMCEAGGGPVGRVRCRCRRHALGFCLGRRCRPALCDLAWRCWWGPLHECGSGGQECNGAAASRDGSFCR